jgi:Na+/H+ antiporter NhaD/arsenite permease-like protein
MKRHYAVPVILLLLTLIYFPLRDYGVLEPKQLQTILVFIALFFMLAMEYRHRTVVSLTSLLILWLLGIMKGEDMIHYLDLDVLGLLFGMMVIVEALREAGFLSILAGTLTSLGFRKIYHLTIALSLFTFITSALLDNATVMLIIIPMTLGICETLNLGRAAVPVLIALSISSNLGGLLTPIGDPPNIMAYSHLQISFIGFILNIGPPTLLIYVISLAVIMTLFRREMTFEIGNKNDKEKPKIEKNSFLIISILVLTLVLLLFLLQDITGISPSASALYGATLLMIIGGRRMAPILREVNWDLLIFLGSILIFSGSLEKVGILYLLAQIISKSTHGNPYILTTLIAWLSSLVSALVDNIPYAAVMIPVIDELVSLTGYYELWWVFLISVGLGGIATPIASVPSLLTYSALRDKFEFKFLDFMKIGLIVWIILTLSLNLYYLLL